MMLLLEDFYLIQSAETLHDYQFIMYHSKCFKYDDSNKKKLYTMSVNIMCNIQVCDSFRKLSERMAKII